MTDVIPPHKTVRELRLELIQNDISNMLDIKTESLDFEALMQPKIYNAIQAYYVQEVRELSKQTTRVSLLTARLRKYYGGKCTPEEYKEKPLRVAVMKSEIDDYIKVDTDMIMARYELQTQEQTVKYLESCIYSLKDRNAAIQSAISFRRMLNGS